MTRTERREKILTALAGVYLRNGEDPEGTMVASLAENLDQKWEVLQEEVRNSHSTRITFAHVLTNEIWMWFSGGGTAEIAANRVIEAVGI